MHIWRESGLLTVGTAVAATVLAAGVVASPIPGMEVNSDTSTCTAGFAAQGGDGAYYLLTAGHCDAGDGAQWTDAGDDPLGTITASDYNGDDHDAAIIRLDPAAGVPDGSIGGRYRVRDVLAPEQIEIGMTLCKIGERTGETCGAITSVDGNLVEAKVFSLNGDSGSPGFVIHPDGSASAVGILASSPEGDDNTTDFVLVWPLLNQWGLRIVS